MVSRRSGERMKRLGRLAIVLGVIAWFIGSTWFYMTPELCGETFWGNGTPPCAGAIDKESSTSSVIGTYIGIGLGMNLLFLFFLVVMFLGGFVAYHGLKGLAQWIIGEKEYGKKSKSFTFRRQKEE